MAKQVLIVDGLNFSFKYAHTFAVSESYCIRCKSKTDHSFSLLSNSLSNNAHYTRIKLCEVCNLATKTLETVGAKTND